LEVLFDTFSFKKKYQTGNKRPSASALCRRGGPLKFFPISFEGRLAYTAETLLARGFAPYGGKVGFMDKSFQVFCQVLDFTHAVVLK